MFVDAEFQIVGSSFAYHIEILESLGKYVATTISVDRKYQPLACLSSESLAIAIPDSSFNTMVVLFDSATNTPSSPDTDTTTTNLVSELSTPLTQSGRTSPTCVDSIIPDDSAAATEKKKKKKKKSKKSGKTEDPMRKATTKEDETRPPVLCISRNKHWRYISSYHVGNDLLL